MPSPKLWWQNEQNRTGNQRAEVFTGFCCSWPAFSVLAVNFAAFGNGSLQALYKPDIPSNRSQGLTSVRVFQKLRVYGDCKEFKVLLGMQYGALFCCVYQMVALSAISHATNASKSRDTGVRGLRPFNSPQQKHPFPPRSQYAVVALIALDHQAPNLLCQLTAVHPQNSAWMTKH